MRPIRPTHHRRVLWREVATIPRPHSLDHAAIAAGLWIRRGQWHTHLVTVHASGRFDAPVADVVAYVVALVAHYKPDILTATEAEQHGVADALQAALGDKYAVEKAAEYLCIRKVATVASNGTPAHVRLTDTAGLRQDWRNLFIGAFPLRLGTLPIMVTVGHCPSAVQAGDHYNGRVQLVTTSRTGFKAWGTWMDARPRPELQLAAMDSNVDHHRRAWRLALQLWLGATSIWTRKRPKTGTHAGRRLIDAIYIRHGKAPAVVTITKEKP